MIPKYKHLRRPILAIAAAALMNSAWGEPAQMSLSPIIEAVLQKGPTNQLPAHLSFVLGISKSEQAVPVKQAVMREAATVRTFNVCSANHADVVLAIYNEQSRSFKAFLVDPTGTLRRAVAYQAGEAPTVRTLSEARGEFSAEFAFWTKFQRPASSNVP